MANINKNIIMQAGAAVANATNKAAGLPASTPEPGTIISAIQLVNGGREIGPAALAHFTESVRNKLLSLLVSIEPIQDFNGYGHPWPAGGGVNKYPILIGDESFVNNGGATHSNDNGSLIIVTDESSSSSGVYLGSNSKIREVLDVYDVPLTISMDIVASESGNVRMIFCGTQSLFTISTTKQRVSITATSNATKNFTIYGVNNGATLTINNLQIESGSTATDYAPYENICPISGRSGANAYVSPTPNVADATTYAADWTTPAGTVYAGSADIVSGDIKAAPYYASYNGETLVGPWVSSMDVYDPEGTPTTGAQVVDLGGTMTEYHITGQDIITLVGDNYIWSDSGDVTITE